MVASLEYNGASTHVIDSNKLIKFSLCVNDWIGVVSSSSMTLEMLNQMWGVRKDTARKYKKRSCGATESRERKNNGKTCDNATETNDFYTTDGKLQKRAAAAFAIAVKHKQQQVTDGRDNLCDKEEE